MHCYTQEIECKDKKRTSKSLLECVEGIDDFKYSVTHDSQLWSLAIRAASVRQELIYDCNKANPPLNFIGWDETKFDNLDIQNCNVSYKFLIS